MADIADVSVADVAKLKELISGTKANNPNEIVGIGSQL
jgi:hypothetical protein